jgi:high-affinity nickel-transport protein
MPPATATAFDLGLVATAFGFGFRHGIDWDHIAALTDITSTQDSPRRSLSLATFYAVGHGLVVFVLGVGAILLSSELPESVDTVMARVVGATLVAFGLYVLLSLARRGRDFRMRSRWMVVASVVRRVVHRPKVVVVEHDHEHAIAEAHDHAHVHVHAHATTAGPAAQHRHVHRHVAPMPDDPFESYSRPTVFAVGMLHGVGGETPTQVLLFVTAAGVGGRAAGLALLVAFVAGLLASNTVIALAGAYGFVHAARHWALYAAISLATAGLSLGIGLLFLLGRDGMLPVLVTG